MRFNLKILQNCDVYKIRKINGLIASVGMCGAMGGPLSIHKVSPLILSSSVVFNLYHTDSTEI